MYGPGMACEKISHLIGSTPTQVIISHSILYKNNNNSMDIKNRKTGRCSI